MEASSWCVTAGTSETAVDTVDVSDAGVQPIEIPGR